MSARVLRKPAPDIWLQLGHAFNQDWHISYGSLPFEHAIKQTIEDWLDPKDRFEIRELIEELFEKAQSTGDFKRAARHLDSEMIFNGNLRAFFSYIQDACSKRKDVTP